MRSSISVAFVLVCSSVLSVCCFVSVAFAVPVCNSRSVLRLLTGFFASFVGHPSCFGLRSWKVVVRFQWHWVFITPRRVQFLCLGGSFSVEILLSSSLLAVPVKLWWSSVGFSLLLRCSPSSLVCSEPVCCRPRVYNMPSPPRSTNNSLSAGLSQDGLPSSSAASLVPTSGSAGSGLPLSVDAIADAVVRALGSSLPVILASLPGNASSPADSVAPASSSASPMVTSADVHVASGASAQLSGTYTLPSFVPTFTPLTATTDSSSALGAPIAATSTCTSFGSILPGVDNASAWLKTEKAFIVGPGHAPVPAKLVSKITGGEFLELADLLSVNLRAAERAPQVYLEGNSKLLVSNAKRRQVEISDILTWTEAFTIFQMVLCAAHPHRWSDLTKYKLLIIQTARQFPGSAWLEYDSAFRKDAAASGLGDWSKMNLDLYNFHLRSPASSSRQQLRVSFPGSSQSSAGSHDTSMRTPFCRSWNEGECLWQFGRCKFRHVCTNCEGEHAKVYCPFPRTTGHRSRSPSPGGKGGRY